MSDYVFDLDNESKVENPPKIFYAGDAFNGQPYITVTEDGIFIAGNKKQVFNITPDYGLQLTGNISLATTPENISIGGYWSLNPVLLSCLPSTSATPIPVLIQNTPPIVKNKSSLDDALSFISSGGL